MGQLWLSDGKTVSGISGTTTYTNKALVGCTSVRLPSGKKRSFGYDNGRLSWERNTSDELVASYSYSLALKNPGAILIGKPNGENAITITRSTGTGESTMRSVYDGFGLKIKDIAESFGGDGGDVVTQTDYDGFDRPLRVWQPYPATSKASTYYGDTHPYSAAEYAGDGSGFVVSATAPGQRMQGHSTQNDRLGNTDAGLLAVRRYIVADGQLTFSCNYPAGALEAVKTIDPDGHTAIVFSDWRGRTVLTRRVLSDGEYADTYTVYDHWGNPLVVLPPLASKTFATQGKKYTLTGTLASEVNNHLYIYGYDDALRQISSKAPGVDAVTTSYDPNGLVAFSTDGNLRKEGRARFTLYDSAARPVVTGICDAPSATEPVPSMLATVGGTGIDNTGYSAAYARLQNPTVLTAAYYDFNTPPACSELTGLTSGFHKKAGLVNGTLERVMNTDRFITTVYDYDDEERVIGQASTTHTPGVTQVVSNSYNIDGSVAASETKLMHPTGNHSDKRTFGYDSHGRLSTVRHSLDGEAEVTLWTGTYNAVGQLATADNGVFAEALGYDVDGTLKSRTSDVFSQQISREVLYNGSISRITDTLDGKQSTATYTYDALDRLTGADIKIGGRDRSTTYTYDLNGNITSLTRMGDDGVDTGRLIDDLSLSYSGNQLTKVTEFADPVFSEATMNFAKSSTLRPHYRYDSNGNLITDPDKSASYRWDVNNRLLEVSFAENNTYVRFTRSASGAKLAEKSRKPVVDGDSQISKTRHYYGPFEYLGNSLARINVTGGYMDDEGKFHAYVADWQGNVRAVVSKQGSGTAAEQATWYYPYGMPTCDSRNAAVNRYKYTAKELITDNATNLYDYPARLYDPVLGRWLSVDPLSHKYHGISHYIHCLSNPIYLVDLDGEKPTPIEALLMAKHVYGGEDANSTQQALKETGWEVSTFRTSIQKNAPWYGNGLNSELYQRKKDDGSYEYAYVFAGTNSLTDAYENIQQVKGQSSQYSIAIANAKTLAKELGDSELTFIGHSLGGGNAAAASMATGKLAITFNAAGVSIWTALKHKLGNANNVYNYITLGKPLWKGSSIYVGGDPVNNAQYKLLLSPPGKRIYVPTDSYQLSHGIDWFQNLTLPDYE